MPQVDALPNSRAARSVEAIRQAASRSGIDFDYLLQQARLESGLNPDAAARTSSATGLYQFIDQTWLGTLRRHGDQHGLGWAATAIRRGNNGRFYVDDPALRRQIMDLRRNPETAAAMAAALAIDNRNALQRHVERPIENVDLYLAHFLGAAGASRFLTEHARNPGASGAAMFPEAASANRSIFYNRGMPRSLDEIRDGFIRRMGQAARLPYPAASGAPPPPRPEPGMMSGPRPSQIAAKSPADPQHAMVLARLAYMTLAELEG